MASCRNLAAPDLTQAAEVLSALVQSQSTSSALVPASSFVRLSTSLPGCSISSVLGAPFPGAGSSSTTAVGLPDSAALRPACTSGRCSGLFWASRFPAGELGSCSACACAACLVAAMKPATPAAPALPSTAQCAECQHVSLHMQNGQVQDLTQRNAVGDESSVLVRRERHVVLRDRCSASRCCAGEQRGPAALCSACQQRLSALLSCCMRCQGAWPASTVACQQPAAPAMPSKAREQEECCVVRHLGCSSHPSGRHQSFVSISRETRATPQGCVRQSATSRSAAPAAAAPSTAIPQTGACVRSGQARCAPALRRTATGKAGPSISSASLSRGRACQQARTAPLLIVLTLATPRRQAASAAPADHSSPPLIAAPDRSRPACALPCLAPETHPNGPPRPQGKGVYLCLTQGGSAPCQRVHGHLCAPSTPGRVSRPEL